MTQAWAIPFCVAAVVVPYLAVSTVSPVDQSAAPFTVPLFGWPELVILHLLAALPCTGIIALSVRDRGLVANPWVACGIGIAFAWVTYGAVASVTVGGFYEGVLARTALCVALELPWCLAAIGVAAGPPRPPALVAVVATFAAVLLPGLSANHLIAEQSQHLTELLSRSRLAPAREVAIRIEGLDPAATVDLSRGPTPIGAIRTELDSATVELEASLRRPVHSPASRVAQARAYLMLGRYPEAAATLKPITSPDPLARFLLGEVYQELGHFADSDKELRLGIDALLPLVATDPGAANLARMGYDSLARNARDRRRPAEAEAVYREALSALPTWRAHFHFQFGRHYESAGRPASALEHFREAERCDPTYSQRVKPHIRALQTASPGCLVGER